MLTTLMIRNGEHREHQQDKWEEYDGLERAPADW